MLLRNGVVQNLRLWCNNNDQAPLLLCGSFFARGMLLVLFRLQKLTPVTIVYQTSNNEVEVSPKAEKCLKFLDYNFLPLYSICRSF